MRVPHLITAMLLSAAAWAQLPFSFSGSAGGDCTPQIHNEPWPGTTVPNNAVRFDWSATNTTADPIPMQVFVYRNTYGIGGGGFVTEQILHSFTITAAPNTTTTGADFWPCASTQFEVNRGHSVRVAGPNGTCTAFSMTVSLVAPAFANDAEGNNSFGTGALITTATDNDGHLRFNGATDDDWYRIQLPAQGKLVITLQSETPADVASTLLADLYYTTGTYINGLSGSTGTNNVPNTNVFEQTCRGGSTITYYLRLRALGGCDVSYRLTVSVVTPVFGIDPVADNTLVAYNTYQDGQQQFDSPNDNSDIFAIAPPFNGVMSIEVQAEHAGPVQSTMQVRLLYSTGAVVQTWNVPSGANGIPITTVVSIPCRGTSPFQRISFQSATCGASYRFKYTVAQPFFTNDAEPNNSSSQAIILPEGQTAQGQVNFADDDNTDSYRANLSSDGVMQVNIEAEHADVSTTGIITVQLYLSTGSILQTWTAPVGANSIAISTPLSVTCRGNSGNYYLSVSSSVCGTSYRISYAVTPPFFAQDVEPNNSTSQAIVLPEGQTAQGHLNFFFGDNVDIYRANLSGDGVMNVNIEAEHADASVTGIITVQLSVSTGTVLQTWTAPVGANSLAIGTALSKTCRGNAPNYYLTVSSDVCGTSYRISYSLTPPFYANDPEPNNSTPGTTMDLNAANQQGHIGFYNTTDDDYYAFTHPGGPWSITLSAEHAGTGDGTMGMVVINNPGTTFGTFTVPVGGSSTALTNTFTIPSLPAGTIYRVRLFDVTCGVSYRIHCYDTDNDGTCNAFDLCAGGPEPGTPCNDNTACTTNDVIQANCSCAGTPVDPNDNNPCTLDSCDPITGVSNVFQDADADGTCDANDLCPGGPEPGTVCNDNNVCTTGDVIGTNCLCAGTFADADADGTCDANDLCPGGSEPGTACNDNNGATINDIIQANCLCAGTLLGNDCNGVPGGPAVPGTACNDNNACTTGDVYGANCLCAGTFADADADGTCDANDLCPGGPEPGTACNDNNACTTGDVIGSNCLCAGTFADADADGTCDANDLCPGGPEPGTACNDNNACTTGDVIGANCLCAGTFADADADGTCDANDLCPGSPEPGSPCNDNNGATINDIIQANCLCAGTLLGNDCEGVPGGPAVPGTACNDNNACTTGDVYGTNCLCAGTFADADGDGTCDANDLCPGGQEPGTACNDNDACTTGDVIGSNCLCAGTFADADADGTCDAEDLCPGGPEPGTACNDGNSSTTDDTINASCDCIGTPTTGCTENEVVLGIVGDGLSNVTWTIYVEGTSTVVDNGGQFYPPGMVNEALCLPDGCYHLVVTDNSGDGIVGGGYLLSMASGERIIDDRNNFTTGSTSAISGGQGFCLPIGTDRLISTNCDKLDWVTNRYVVATVNPAVSSEWILNGNNNVQDANSGYEFWIFDPNGSYSFRRFRSHKVSDGQSPANASRACHMKINSWVNTALTPHIPNQLLLNIRVRGRVNGANFGFGPACLFKLDPARAGCPLVALQSETITPSGPNCDQTRNWGGTNSAANRLTSQAPQPVPSVSSGSVRYQYRFSHPEQCVVLPPQTSPTRHLNWNSSVASALVPGRTYQVDVRVSLNSGATWCIGSPSTSAATNCGDLTPWGPVCNVTIAGGMGSMMAIIPDASDDATLTMYPNPNRGDQLFLSLSVVPADVHTVSVDIFDMTGKRVVARTLAVQDGFLNTAMELNGELAGGLYLVNIIAGEKSYTERLVIQP